MARLALPFQSDLGPSHTDSGLAHTQCRHCCAPAAKVEESHIAAVGFAAAVAGVPAADNGVVVALVVGTIAEAASAGISCVISVCIGGTAWQRTAAAAGASGCQWLGLGLRLWLRTGRAFVQIRRPDCKRRRVGCLGPLFKIHCFCQRVSTGCASAHMLPFRGSKNTPDRSLGGHKRWAAAPFSNEKEREREREREREGGG